MKWEYFTVLISDDPGKTETSLNNLGNVGWELVAVDNGTAYLKRPVKQSAVKEFELMINRVRPDYEYRVDYSG